MESTQINAIINYNMPKSVASESSAENKKTKNYCLKFANKNEAINMINEYINYHDNVNELSQKCHMIVDKLYNEWYQSQISEVKLFEKNLNIEFTKQKYGPSNCFQFWFCELNEQILLPLFADIDRVIYHKPDLIDKTVNIKELITLISIPTFDSNLQHIVIPPYDNYSKFEINDDGILLVKIYCECKIKKLTENMDKNLDKFTKFYNKFFTQTTN